MKMTTKMEEIFGTFQEEYVPVDGIRLHVMMFGMGEPLFLLHGFPDFWYGWKDLILLLKNEFKLIVPDLRGYNLSDKPEGVENYEISLLVSDIKILAEKLDLSNYSVCGHDWGGMIAWNFAEKYPDLLKKLIILNAPHPKVFRKKLQTDKHQRKASGYIFKFLEPNGEKGLYENEFQTLKFSVFGTAVKEYDEFDKSQYIQAWKQPGAILGGVNYYRANMAFENFTGIINVPTLVLHGMKDMFVTSAVLDGLDEYVKDLTLVRVKDASHWIQHDQPEFIAKKIKDFLKDNG